MTIIKKHHEWLILTAALILAAVLRFGWVGISSFSFDEARVSQLALQMARQGDFAELGMQSSTGVPNFPAAVWLFALPYFFTPNPQIATSFAALISWLGVLGFWWLGRAGWGKWAGLSAALLYAAYPFIISYSRNIWSQNLLAPFAILWAITAVVGMSDWAEKNGHGRWLPAVALAAHAFLAGFVVQIHIAGASLALASLWLGLRYRLWNRWLPIVIGSLLAVLAAAPSIYIIARFGSGAQAELADILSAPAETQWQGFQQLLNLGLNHKWERLWLNEAWVWPQPLELLLQISSILLTLLLIGGTILTIRKIITDWRLETHQPTPTHLLTNLLPIWAIVAPLFFLRSKTPVVIHYHLSSLPALLLLALSPIALLSERGRKIFTAGIALMTLIFALAVGQTLTMISDELIPGGMGTPLRYPQAAVDTLTADGRPLAIHTFGAEIAFDGDAAVFNVLLWEQPKQIVDGRSVLLIPSQPTHLLSTFDDIPAWQIAHTLGILDMGSVTPLPRRQNEPPYMAVTLDTIDLAPLFDPTPEYTLENGAILQGWRLDELEDGRLRLITHWYLTQPANQQFQQFNHLYLQDSPTPDQVRDVTLSSQSWQANNHLITWVEFDRPSTPVARFDIGMYTWPDLQRSPILTRNGQPRDGDPLAPIQLTP